jgi:hypothetical protein
MIHLMELPNPDPTELAARPEHGGRDRHMCATHIHLSRPRLPLTTAGLPTPSYRRGGGSSGRLLGVVVHAKLNESVRRSEGRCPT